MNITRFSIQRPIGISMIVLFFVVLGLFSYYRIGVELLPALNTPYVSVWVRYPGASVESMEQQVVKPLEDALASVPNLKHMTANASSGSAYIVLELDFSADADYASIEATKKVNSIRSRLPEEIEEPVVMKRDMDDSPVVEIAVLSKTPLSDIYSMAYNVFQEKLQQSSGVSEIELYGGRDKEVAVEVDKDKMAFYHLSLDQVVSKIGAENVLMPSGSVYTSTRKTDIRVTAQYENAAEIEKLEVTNALGNAIPITAFAAVKAQDARADRYGRVNGQDAVSLAIYKNSEANIVATADNILKNLEELRAEYPDYEFIIVSNSATYVRNSLHNTLGALFEGLFTTGMVLFFFLRGWRSTATVMIAIPTSLIATFFVMYIAGFTFNMMSLMGMALCVGILVDDSIVVLENIYRHMAMGKNASQAAEEGRMEIGMAAIAITLCDVVVFLPIAFMTGMTGQFFRQFALTIVFATMFSLFVSYTLTPMMASQFFKKGLPVPKGRVWDFLDRLEESAKEYYERALRWSLKNAKKVLAIAAICFIGAMSLLPLGWIGAEYMPKTDESSFDVNIELSVGETVEQTDAVMTKLEEYVASVPEVKHYLSRIGGRNAHEGRLRVELVNRKDRNRTVWEVADGVRAFAAQNITNATVRVSETQSSVAGVSGGMRGSGGSLQVELYGRNLEELVEASNAMQEAFRQIPGLKDIKSSYTEGMPEIQLSIDREKLKYYHTSIGEVERAFSSAIAGKGAGVIANDKENNDQDTDINVRLQGSDGYRISDIEKVPIQTGGKILYLGDVATLKEGVGPVSIRRVDKERAINLRINPGDRTMGEVMKEMEKILRADLPEGVTYRFTGAANSMTDTFMDMAEALFLALILVYILLAVLYESVLTPFIRMFSLPLGMIGSLFFLLMTGNTVNLYSLIGILVMDGLVAKNGTLLLDYTLTLMQRGMNAYDAVIEAGRVRLKPIFMTTLTMISGMMPTALAMTEGSETRVSMAWVIIGGLLTSTIFTLLVIPIIFLFFERHPIRGWFKFFSKSK